MPPPADVSDGVEGDVVEEGEDEEPHLGRQAAHVLVPLEFSFDYFSAGFLKYSMHIDGPKSQRATHRGQIRAAPVVCRAGSCGHGGRVGLGAVEGEEGEAVAQRLHPDPPAHRRVEGALTVLKKNSQFLPKEGRLREFGTEIV